MNLIGLKCCANLCFPSHTVGRLGPSLQIGFKCKLFSFSEFRYLVDVKVRNLEHYVGFRWVEARGRQYQTDTMPKYRPPSKLLLLGVLSWALSINLCSLFLSKMCENSKSTKNSKNGEKFNIYQKLCNVDMKTIMVMVIDGNSVEQIRHHCWIHEFGSPIVPLFPM